MSTPVMCERHDYIGPQRCPSCAKPAEKKEEENPLERPSAAAVEDAVLDFNFEPPPLH